ncbi:MAG: hypothetical protein IJD10_04560 [Clostridia bacterium]|nr:hypothetical protein [Clostridia bacterium]
MKLAKFFLCFFLLGILTLTFFSCRRTEDSVFTGIPTVYRIFDFRTLGEGGNQEDANDIVRFYTSLQGRLNKRARRTGIYVYQMFDSTDEFWLNYLRSEGKMLQDSKIVDIRSFSALWETFRKDILAAGIVVWDPNVPATANVAATACSVEGYLPVRYDTDADSLYTWLTAKGVTVKLNLCGLFTGKIGTKIADTDIDSSGSIKCDPYLWAMEKYLDRCHPSMLAYVLDGASQVATNPMYEEGFSDPNINQLYSHDYYIYSECFFFDLICTRSEAPCDDPDQKKGTDYNTLIKILDRVRVKNDGKMCKLMGFPPWYMKYTTYRNRGSIEPTTLEWNFASVLSYYNVVKEADAAQPAWMTNASVYCQYESTVETYENPKPEVTEVFDEKVRYFTYYLGDYDSSAWLKGWAPTHFESDSRGQIPLMWAFNPNLSDRIPMVFDYIYENKTDLDYIITGNSGAGYVMPSYLREIEPWIEYCKPYMEKFDMNMVGFIINKAPLTERELKAYAEISPYGSAVTSLPKGEQLVVYDNKTVYITMRDSSPHMEGWVENTYGSLTTTGSNFCVIRTILQKPEDTVDQIEQVTAYANAQNDGYTYKYVDMYTLFDLVLQSGQGKYLYSNND